MLGEFSQCWKYIKCIDKIKLVIYGMRNVEWWLSMFASVLQRNEKNHACKRKKTAERKSFKCFGSCETCREANKTESGRELMLQL